jgi:hypothetical protein
MILSGPNACRGSTNDAKILPAFLHSPAGRQRRHRHTMAASRHSLLIDDGRGLLMENGIATAALGISGAVGEARGTQRFYAGSVTDEQRWRGPSCHGMTDVGGGWWLWGMRVASLTPSANGSVNDHALVATAHSHFWHPRKILLPSPITCGIHMHRLGLTAFFCLLPCLQAAYHHGSRVHAYVISIEYVGCPHRLLFGVMMPMPMPTLPNAYQAQMSSSGAARNEQVIMEENCTNIHS